jgi:hypothetical protein
MEREIEYRICPAFAPDGSLLHMLIRIRRQAVDENGIKAFPEQARVGRKCLKCHRLEYLSDDKKRWNRGAYGTLVLPASLLGS